MACPALPSCGLAVTEAERALPGLIDEFEAELSRMGLSDERFTVRMTGCPNGCARPYNAEIGINGRTKTNYDVYVGGSPGFGRMAQRLRADVALDDIPALLQPVFASYAKEADPDEVQADLRQRLQVGTPA